MNKKQVIAVSTVAAVPAMGLLVFLVLGLLQGMLSDGATVSITLWIVWVLAALGSIVMGFLPFAIMFFPGLMPEPTAAGISESPMDTPSAGSAGRSTADDEDEAGEEEFDEQASAEDEGEQLFDDDAIEEDFDDFGDSFDDDEK